MPFDSKVEVPRWIVRVASWLLAMLSFGAVGTIVMVVFWLVALSSGQFRTSRRLDQIDKRLESVGKTVGAPDPVPASNDN